VRSSIELVCEANQFRRTYETDSSGPRQKAAGVRRLRHRFEQPGFAPYHNLVEIRSAVPEEFRIFAEPRRVNTSVNVKDTETLVTHTEPEA